MKGKKKIYLDFDNTIVNSVKAFCDVYNTYYYNKYPNKHKMEADWTKVRVWDFRDECADLTLEDVEDIFASEPFFYRLEAYEGAKKILKKLEKEYDLTLCTVGTAMNISRKAKWVDKHLGEIKNHIYIVNKGMKTDKSMVDMSNAIFVDDNQKNLFGSNADIKICYGTLGMQWNNEWVSDNEKLFNCCNWEELYDIIKKTN